MYYRFLYSTKYIMVIYLLTSTSYVTDFVFLHKESALGIHLEVNAYNQSGLFCSRGRMRLETKRSPTYGATRIDLPW